MKRLFGIALLLVVLAVTASANEAIWREGEDPTATCTFNHGWIENMSGIDFSLMSPGAPGGATGGWVAHIASGNSPAYWQITFNVAEGGTYTWWARILPGIVGYPASYTYSIDGGTAQPVDLSHQHEVINILRPNINANDYLGWVRIATGVPLSIGSHTVRLTAVYNASSNQTQGAVDCICLVNFPWTPTGTLQPTGTTNPDPTPGPTTWFPLHIAEDALSPNSIIDMRGLIASTTGVPAGTFGHVTRVQDHFELSGKPGVAVKFWGTDATHPGFTATFDQQAKFYAKYGINLVRRHPMFEEIGESQDPGLQDTYDQWFATLKANGVYTDMGFFYPDYDSVSPAFVPAPDADFSTLLAGAGVTMSQLWNELPSGGGSNKLLGGFDNFVTPYQQGQWAWEQKLLQHTNPYTGLQYVNDPALAITEVHNEDALFWWWPLGDLSAGTTYPNHTRLLRYMWFKWLGAKYADDAALQAAWGAGWQTGDSVVTFNPNMMLYNPWVMDSTTSSAPAQKARVGDFVRFLAETQRACYQTRFDNLTALGYQGIKVSTAWMVGGAGTAAANLWADDAGDAIDRHNYIGGVGSWYIHAATNDNSTHLNQPGYGILSGEPILGVGPGGAAPNESVFQVEDKPAMMSEWDQDPPNQWRAEISPLFAFYGMGLQGWDASLHFAGSYAWMETGWPGQAQGPSNWVSETPVYMAQWPALAMAIYRGDIAQGDAAAARRMSVDDVFRGVDPLSQDLPNGGYPGSQNMYTNPEVFAIGRVTAKADASLTSSDSQKLDWTQYWDQTNKIITSTAGGGTLHQLVWDYNNKVVQVKSPKTQAIIGWAGGHGAYNLGDVQATVTTPFVSLIFTSLDNLPLSSSTSILVTALAQDTQMGAAYNSDGSNLTAVGGPPLLLQPVQANVTIGGLSISTVKVVDVYGVPTSATVPVNANSFTIDGTYATYYYQIQRTPPAIALSTNSLTPSCVHGSSPANDTFQVWNAGNVPLNYSVSKDQTWLSVSPPNGTSSGPTDKKTETVTYSTAGLTAGNYNATITVSDPNATNTPQTIAVQLTINPAPPAIALSTTTLTPSCAQTTNALSQTFKVWNSADQTLNYTVSKDQSWLSVSPGSGSSTGPTNQQTHTVTYSTSGLALGGYDATITVTAAGASNTPQTICVHLSVLSAPPVISASAASFTSTALKGQNAPSQSLDIWNSGQGMLTYAAIVSTTEGPPGWAGVSPGTGGSTGVGNTQTHSVDFSTANMDVGTYHASIVITSAGATNTPLTIPITLTITAPGTIVTDTVSLNPTAVVGGAPADQTMHIWNAGTGTMDYTISSGQTWLTVNPTSGSSTGVGDPQTHTVRFGANLGAGLHTANITITGAGISNAPQTIPVNFNVTAPPAIQITSPLDGTVLTTPTVTVTGVVGVPGSYQAIWVNGVLATNTGAGFSTWQAPIPLNQNWINYPNPITVSTLDNAGVYVANAASVTVQGVGPNGTLGSGLIHSTGMAMTVNGAVVPGDVDTYQFQAAAGSTVTLTAKGVGKPAPGLTLVLCDNYDQQMLSRTGSSISLTSVLPGNGLYTLCLYPVGDGGQYTLTLAGTPPNMKWTQNDSIPTQMSVYDHTMAMPKGTLLTASVSSTKFQPTLQVLDPLGNVIPLGGFLTTATGKVTVKNLPIPGGTQNYLPGNYILRVGSGDGRVGAFTLTCAGLAPTPVPDLVNYPLILGTSAAKNGVAPGAQLQLSVSGAHTGGIAWIDYGGVSPVLVPINSTSLVNGKGSVYITVPAWMSQLPPGTLAFKVYLMDWGSGAFEYTNKVSVQLAR